MTYETTSRYLNRDLSWLEFNQRVLAEAENDEVPVLERLKFCAIVSSNLDEFYMVRMPLLTRNLESTSLPALSSAAHSLLTAVQAKTHALVKQQYRCYQKKLLPLLRKNRVEIVRKAYYTDTDTTFLRRTFDEQIFPVLTPLAIDPSHPFPLLANGAVYLLFQVKQQEERANPFGSQAEWLLIQVPVGMKRFLSLPAPAGTTRLAVLDDCIACFSGHILHGYSLEGACAFRVTRDADLRVDEELSENLLLSIEEELHQRRRGAPVRLEIDASTPASVLRYLQGQLELTKAETFSLGALLNLTSYLDLVTQIPRPDLKNAPWTPQPHPLLPPQADLFACIALGDILLHHPYHAYDPVIRLVEQAANDPSVLAIKMTLYRVSGDSPIVSALIQAAKEKKQVTVIVELRARFDEEANIEWARQLDQAGAHVIFGVMGLKTHAKALLIIRQEAGGIERYVHLGTGNYNDKTARFYTDLGIMSNRHELSSDLSAFFNVITGYSQPPAWKTIEMAPTGLRRRFLSLIERETEKHSPEVPGFIRVKCNSLIDKEIIEALYRASQAGVRIEMIIRGLCGLRAGVAGLSESIRVVSIVDRYLEHPRIYHFGNGGADELYLSSADWMERNMDTRIELLFPVLDNRAKDEVRFVLDVALKDNCKAWELKDSTYTRVRRGRHQRLQSQEVLFRRAQSTANDNEAAISRSFITRPLRKSEIEENAGEKE